LMSILAGCASPSVKRVVDVTPEEAPRLLLTPADLERGDHCRVSLTPAPALEDLMDSPAVHADLERLQAESGPVQGRALLTIRVDSTGAPTWIDILDTDLPAPVGAGIVRAFEGRLKPVRTDGEDGPRLEGWAHRIEVRLAERPAMRVGNPVLCTPRVVNEEEDKRLLQQRIEASEYGRASCRE